MFQKKHTARVLKQRSPASASAAAVNFIRKNPFTPVALHRKYSLTTKSNAFCWRLAQIKVAWNLVMRHKIKICVNTNQNKILCECLVPSYIQRKSVILLGEGGDTS